MGFRITGDGGQTFKLGFLPGFSRGGAFAAVPDLPMIEGNGFGVAFATVGSWGTTAGLASFGFT
jgi:hypothetical protein